MAGRGLDREIQAGFWSGYISARFRSGTVSAGFDRVTAGALSKFDRRHGLPAFYVDPVRIPVR